MITVFHAHNPKWEMDPNIKDEALVPVATIHGNDLDMAFERTNHIFGNWCDTDADDIMVLGGGEHRSTSVGDVMVNDYGRFVVDKAGFHKVNGDFRKSKLAKALEQELPELVKRHLDRVDPEEESK